MRMHLYVPVRISSKASSWEYVLKCTQNLSRRLEVGNACRRPAARDEHKRVSQDAGYAEHFCWGLQFSLLQ